MEKPALVSIHQEKPNGSYKVILDGCFENKSEFLEGTYGRVRDGANQSQQCVQHIARFRDKDFADGSFFNIALRKGKHIVEERGRWSENAAMNVEFIGVYRL